MASINKTTTTPNDTEGPSTSKNNPHKPQPPLLKFVSNKIATKIRTSQVDAIISIRQYLENENSIIASDPLHYWQVRYVYDSFSTVIFKFFIQHNSNSMPVMKSCALRYLCIPATSTESERMFSKAGSIVSERRACLKPKNVDMLLFINKNYWTTQ